MIATGSPARTGPRPRPVDIGKPRLRGLLHLYAFFVAAACGVVLVAVAAGRPGVAPRGDVCRLLR